jgi:hypothetical protein
MEAVPHEDGLLLRGSSRFALVTMVPGLPVTISAKPANRTRQVVANVGDGGVAMRLAEKTTAVPYVRSHSPVCPDPCNTRPETAFYGESIFYLTVNISASELLNPSKQYEHPVRLTEKINVAVLTLFNRFPMSILIVPSRQEWSAHMGLFTRYAR